MLVCSICLRNEDDCSWQMPRCGLMFHDKCIQTWKASCKSEQNSIICPSLPTMQKAIPEVAYCFLYKLRGTLPRPDPRRPSSSHELGSILISLELPVSILLYNPHSRTIRGAIYPLNFIWNNSDHK